MPKSRTKIYSKGLSDALIYDYVDNLTFDPGYIESIEFTKEIESEKIVDATGSVIDELVKSESVGVTGVLLQSSISELEILSKKRYAYFRAWGRVSPEVYQVLVLKEAVVRPAFRKVFNSEVAKINLQLTGIKNPQSISDYYILDIDAGSFPPVFEKVIDFYWFGLYDINSPAEESRELTMIDFLGHRKGVVYWFKDENMSLLRTSEGWQVTGGGGGTSSIVANYYKSSFDVGEAIIYVGVFRLDSDFYFAPRGFVVTENARVNKFLIYRDSTGTKQRFLGNDFAYTFDGNIGFDASFEGSESYLVKAIYIYKNLTDAELNKLKEFVDAT